MDSIIDLKKDYIETLPMILNIAMGRTMTDKNKVKSDIAFSDLIVDVLPAMLDWTIDEREAICGHLLHNLGEWRSIFVELDEAVLQQYFGNPRDLKTKNKKNFSPPTQVEGKEEIMRFLNRLVRYFWNNAVDLYLRFLDLFALLGYECDLAYRRRGFQKLLLYVTLDEHIEWIKYQTILIMNYSIGTSNKSEYPVWKLPFKSGSLWSSHFKSWVFRKTAKNIRISNTIFQGFKRCLLPISPRKVFKTLASHATALGTKPTSLDEALRLSIVRKTKALLKYCDEADIEKTGTVSLSASFARTRASGGNYAELREALDQAGFLKFEHFFETFTQIHESKERFEMKEVCGLSDETLFEGLRFLQECVKNPVIGILTEPGERSNSLPLVESKPKVILEPFKGRIITCSDLYGNSFLDPFQQYLLKGLQRVPGDPFKLTRGHPVREAVTDLVTSYRGKEDDTEIVSADYSAATDTLNGEVTLAIFNTIREVLLGRSRRSDIGTLLEQVERSLLDNILTYSNKSIPTELDLGETCQWSLKVDQVTGQLMGSKPSFPILCYANFIAYWISLERKESREQARPVSIGLSDLMRRYPCLVNGDDLLFLSKRPDIELWNSTVSEFGFRPSPGKNFINKKFGMINSVLFERDPCGPIYGKPYVVFHPYVNMGLALQRKKGSNVQEVERVSSILTGTERLPQISKIYDELASRFAGSERLRIDSLFIESYSKLIPARIQKKLNMSSSQILYALVNGYANTEVDHSSYSDLDEYEWEELCRHRALGAIPEIIQGSASLRFRYLLQAPVPKTVASEVDSWGFTNLKLLPSSGLGERSIRPSERIK